MLPVISSKVSQWFVTLYMISLSNSEGTLSELIETLQATRHDCVPFCVAAWPSCQDIPLLKKGKLLYRLYAITLLTEAIIIFFFFFRIMWIAYVAEFWVYPFLRIMPNSFKAAFFSMSFCILAFFYFLGKWMTLFIWRGT